MRLIDADVLIDFIDLGHLRSPSEICFSEFDVVDMLEDCATVDAVEVVRCKDCKHGKCVGIEYFCCAHSGSERKLGEDRHYSEWHDGNWFCADGKRKEASE